MRSATETAVTTTSHCVPARALRVEHGHVVRDDIQLLRGVAVLAVLFYHADSHLLPGGYLGVDVFFVVSGFLITRNIFQAIRDDTFSYASFIAGRFRRLLPACYAMLVFSAILANVVLVRQDMAEFVRQTLATLTFSSNLFLWRQSGYFDTASSLKLLLHTWSLSLEEQYYLFLPLVLYLGRRGNTLKLLVGVLAGSLLACFVLVSFKPSAAFYLLPFRAWELLAGSVCAVVVLNKQVPRVPNVLKVAALSALLLTFLFPPTATHPGPSALLVVPSTAMLLVGAIDFGRSSLARGMYFFGDISYSLYLFHWPLIAVANHIYADVVPIPVKLALMITAVALSYLSYELIEQPFRAVVSPPRRRVFLLAAGLGILVMLFASWLYVARSPSPGEKGASDAPNYGLGKACAFADEFVVRPECQTATTPSVLLWGDSYAMHLADALGQQTTFGFIQATKSLCGPVPGVAPIVGMYNKIWAQSCVSFNDSVLRYLDAHPAIRLVILGSKWRQYFDIGDEEGFLVRRTAGGMPMFTTFLDSNVVETSVHTLVARITGSGRKVLIIQPPPSSDVNIYRCLQRAREGLPYIGATDRCQIDEAEAVRKDAGLTALIRGLAPFKGVYAFSFNPLLCDGKTCRPEMDGVPLYRDEGHLSQIGSRILGRRSGLNAFIGDLIAQDGQ